MSSGNQNIFDRIADKIYNLEKSFVSKVTSEKYTKIEDWEEGKTQNRNKSKTAGQESIDPKNKEDIALENSENSYSENQESAEASENFVVELLKPREIAKRAQKKFFLYSGFNWLSVLICVVGTALAPFFEKKRHLRDENSYTFLFSDIGEYIANGDMIPILIMSIGMVCFFPWIISFRKTSKKNGVTNQKTTFSFFKKKDYVTYSYQEYIFSFFTKSETDQSIAYKKSVVITEAYRQTFTIINFHCFLGAILHSFTVQLLLFVAYNIFYFPPVWAGFIFMVFMLLNMTLYIEYKESVARVVCEDWMMKAAEASAEGAEGAETSAEEAETPTDSYQK